ncbi:hypothetical protein [Nonomuraea sp. NPDC046570]|uniref:hypothetical protein n=1 Tax=Nonomuraea sp. NPDC046570 TaxID=3155255 RepID=UPI0033CFCDF3
MAHLLAQQSPVRLPLHDRRHRKAGGQRLAQHGEVGQRAHFGLGARQARRRTRWFFGNGTFGTCPSPRDGRPGHWNIGATGGSALYVLEDITNRDRPGGFSGWRWCFKCTWWCTHRPRVRVGAAGTPTS